jgi:hypothetical protein
MPTQPTSSAMSRTMLGRDGVVRCGSAPFAANAVANTAQQPLANRLIAVRRSRSDTPGSPPPPRINIRVHRQEHRSSPLAARFWPRLTRPLWFRRPSMLERSQSETAPCSFQPSARTASGKFKLRFRSRRREDRAFRLRSGGTSAYGRYVKPLRGPAAGASSSWIILSGRADPGQPEFVREFSASGDED